MMEDSDYPSDKDVVSCPDEKGLDLLLILRELYAHFIREEN